MASDTKNVKLGVCKVYLDGVDMGYTKGGVEFSVSTETHEVVVDQFGKSAINELIMGRSCKVKIPLAETTVENIAANFPNTAGSGLEGTATKRAFVDSGVGVDLLKVAKALVLHPQGKMNYDYSDELVIPFAATPGALQFAYKLDDERVFNTEFTGYPDAKTNRLFVTGNVFSDASGVSFTPSFTASSSTIGGFTGLTAAVTGRAVMFGTADATGALPEAIVERKVYFLKYVSATTATIHLTRDDAIAGTAAVTMGLAGTLGATAVKVCFI